MLAFRLAGVAPLLLLLLVVHGDMMEGGEAESLRAMSGGVSAKMAAPMADGET